MEDGNKGFPGAPFWVSINQVKGTSKQFRECVNFNFKIFNLKINLILLPTGLNWRLDLPKINPRLCAISTSEYMQSDFFYTRDWSLPDTWNFVQQGYGLRAWF